jgi:hypothetical protein
MLDALSQTKPWARFFSIIGFLSIGIMIIVGFSNMVGFLKTNDGGAFLPGVMSFVVNIIFGVLYFFPSLFLFKYASSIGRLLDGGGVKEMVRRTISKEISQNPLAETLPTVEMVFQTIGQAKKRTID